MNCDIYQKHINRSSLKGDTCISISYMHIYMYTCVQLQYNRYNRVALVLIYGGVCYIFSCYLLINLTSRLCGLHLQALEWFFLLFTSFISCNTFHVSECLH